jgi:hypothetical protein
VTGQSTPDDSLFDGLNDFAAEEQTVLARVEELLGALRDAAAGEERINVEKIWHKVELRLGYPKDQSEPRGR